MVEDGISRKHTLKTDFNGARCAIESLMKNQLLKFRLILLHIPGHPDSRYHHHVSKDDNQTNDSQWHEAPHDPRVLKFDIFERRAAILHPSVADSNHAVVCGIEQIGEEVVVVDAGKVEVVGKRGGGGGGGVVVFHDRLDATDLEGGVGVPSTVVVPNHQLRSVIIESFCLDLSMLPTEKLGQDSWLNFCHVTVVVYDS